MISDNVVAFDFGTKSIGAAVANLRNFALTESCSELPPLNAKDGIPNWDDLQRLLGQWQPQKIIVGLPLHTDGTDLEITRRARKFGSRIKGRLGYPVEFFDERLSTREAKHEAYARGHRGNFASQPVDSIAARLILESWLREMY